ncbi:hypothetical protein [Leptothrix ochracea]|uniref:hypothetical protein n=1 Tax=Leptothrix ochracea TaxID=735331 RepID=UPI0034E1F1A2
MTFADGPCFRLDLGPVIAAHPPLPALDNPALFTQAKIGISRRMLSYYLSGAKPIPKTVWLACLGWQALEHSEAVAHA